MLKKNGTVGMRGDKKGRPSPVSREWAALAINGERLLALLEAAFLEVVLAEIIENGSRYLSVL